MFKTTASSRISSKIIKRRVKGYNGLQANFTDRVIWKPKGDETLLLIAAYIVCTKAKSVTDANAFELEVNNSDVVASVDAPTNAGETQRLAIASQTSFTRALPLTITQTDAGAGDQLELEFVFIALKV